MVAYIVSDSIAEVARALEGNKFFNTREGMLINTADIVAIMTPYEWENQRLYQRGWYIEGFWWVNKKGEYVEKTELGKKLERADKRATSLLTSRYSSDTNEDILISDAKVFIEKLVSHGLYDLYKRHYKERLAELEEIIENK